MFYQNQGYGEESVMEDAKLNIRPQKSSFAGDVLKMASAPLCTQILGIILMPIVTRLYAPDVYGVFNLFGAIVMPISVFVTMGYNSSIVLPQRDEIASNMLCISLGLTVLIAVLTVPLIWLGSDFFLHWLKVPELGIYLWLIPINVFAIGLWLSLRFWNVRGKRFGRIAISRISDAVVNKGILIGAGFSGFATAGSLIIGAIAGSMTMSAVLGGRIWQESGQLFKRSIRWSNIIQGIKRYRKFPLYNLPTALLGRLSASITIFLFSFYFSKSVIGYYGLGLAVLSMPMTFIGSSISEVFYQRGARARHEDTNASLVEKLFKQMTWMSMLPFFLLAIIGDSIFAFVFGANWSEAGVYAQILSFKIFISFIISPASSLPNILEKQEVSLFLYIATIITSFISITVGGLLNNVYVALCLFSLLGGLVFFGFGLFMICCVGLPLSRIFSILLRCFVSCLPIIIVVALAKWCFGVSPLLLIIISTIGCVIYYCIFLKEDKVLQSTIMLVFRKAKATVA
jgi:lipopolysaccharide exporter